MGAWNDGGVQGVAKSLTDGSATHLAACERSGGWRMRSAAGYLLSICTEQSTSTGRSRRTLAAELRTGRLRHYLNGSVSCQAAANLDPPDGRVTVFSRNCSQK